MRVVLSIFLVVLLTGCKKNIQVSDCIQSKLDAFKISVRYQGASVKQYTFQGQLVYVFDDGSSIADGAADVYDSVCEYLGSLGGLIGNSKINGVDFNSNSKYKRTLWHN